MSLRLKLRNLFGDRPKSTLGGAVIDGPSEAVKNDSDSRTEHREEVSKTISIEQIPAVAKQKPTRDVDEVFVGSIDQGTTSTRFLIFNKQGEPVASHQIEFKQYHPRPGWHEHDPEEILSSAQTCIDKAVEKFESDGYTRKAIAAIGITNQRETTLVWDKHTGKSLHNAIAWPDTRTTTLVRELKQQSGSEKLREICGLPLSTYPSSVKLIWLLRNDKEVKKAYDEGRLAFGTVDTWLLYRLNGGTEKNVFVTDATNASRTMFVDLKTLEYSRETLDFFGLDENKLSLPKIVPSSDPEAYGTIATGALKGTKIAGCLGDQSAALVGQCGFDPGNAKNTYGTGCFLLYNVGEKPVISNHGLLATVAYHFGGNRKPVYALEGSIAVAGSGIKFLVNNLGIGDSSEKISELAGTVKDSGGCVFVTAFSGLFAPYWIDDAQGTIFGITQHTKKGHIARATIEATCFQTKAILDAMEKDCGHKLQELAVDGGMTNSDLVMQTQANILSIPVDRPSMRETTSLGAAIAAGFAVGVWKEFSELKNINRDGRQIFKPELSTKESTDMFALWSRAVEMCRGWVQQEEKEQSAEEDDQDKASREEESDAAATATSNDVKSEPHQNGIRGGSGGSEPQQDTDNNTQHIETNGAEDTMTEKLTKVEDDELHTPTLEDVRANPYPGHRGGARGGVISVRRGEPPAAAEGESSSKPTEQQQSSTAASSGPHAAVTKVDINKVNPAETKSPAKDGLQYIDDDELRTPTLDDVKAISSYRGHGARGGVVHAEVGELGKGPGLERHG